MWADALIKVIYNHFRLELSEDLGVIDSHLRAKININDIVRYQDKLLSLTRNHPKGDGDDFHTHTEEYHPDSLLIPVPSLKGKR